MKIIRIFFLILFLLCFIMNCQNKKTESKESVAKKMIEKELVAENKKLSYFRRIAETSDRLYLNDSSSFYLMDQSPLKVFHNYRDIYDTYHEFAPVEFDMLIGSFIPPGPNTSYYVHWLLIDSTLYLADINFFEDVSTVFSNNEQYRVMEELAREKFNKRKIGEYHLPKSIRIEEGLMPAVWVSNVFLIKKARDSKPREYPEESLESWIKEPCMELVFRKGRLVSMKVKEDMY